MKKIVVKLSIKDSKDQQRAMRAVSTLTGIDSLSANMKEGTLTVVGDVDPVDVSVKLKKKWNGTIHLVEDANKKKEEEKKKDEKKKDEGKKVMNRQVSDIVQAYRNYYNPSMSQYYVPHSMEENPNACVIC